MIDNNGRKWQPGRNCVANTKDNDQKHRDVYHDVGKGNAKTIESSPPIASAKTGNKVVRDQWNCRAALSPSIGVIPTRPGKLPPTDQFVHSISFVIRITIRQRMIDERGERR